LRVTHLKFFFGGCTSFVEEKRKRQSYLAPHGKTNAVATARNAKGVRHGGNRWFRSEVTSNVVFGGEQNAVFADKCLEKKSLVLGEKKDARKG